MNHFLVLGHSRIWFYYHSLWLTRVQLKGLIRSSGRAQWKMILELTRYEQ
jgi:hypothetical protein